MIALWTPGLGNLFPAAGGSRETGTRYQAEGNPAAGTRLLKVSAGKKKKKNELLPHGPTLSLIPPRHSTHNLCPLSHLISQTHPHLNPVTLRYTTEVIPYQILPITVLTVEPYVGWKKNGSAIKSTCCFGKAPS